MAAKDFYALVAIGRRFNAAAVWPGIVLVAMISAVAFSARSLPGLTAFGPIILTLIVGLVFPASSAPRPKRKQA